jgi:hypothetical protein
MELLKLTSSPIVSALISTLLVSKHVRILLCTYAYSRHGAARTYLCYLAPTRRRASLTPHHNIHQRAAGTSGRGSGPAGHGSVQFYHLFAAGVYDGLRLLHLLPSSFSVEATGLLAAGEL